MTESRIDDQGRPEPPLAADETATLLGFLDYQRATLEWKTRGLDEAALRRTLDQHPSGMTLAGLVKHLAYVEDYWFSEVMAGREDIDPWAGVDWRADGDWDWHSAADDSAEELRSLWEASIARSRSIVTTDLAAEDALARTYPAWGGQAQVSFRWILTHMIEEYARHNGHADLLRELVDGQTGE